MPILSPKLIFKPKIQPEKLIWLLMLTAFTAGLLFFHQKLVFPITQTPRPQPGAGQSLNGDSSAIAQNPIPISNLPEGELPAGITQDMILGQDQDAEIIQSFTADIGDYKQSTLRYKSARSVPDSQQAYLDYLTENNWALSRELGNPEVSIVSMKAAMVDKTIGEIKRLELTITPAEGSGGSIVDITVTISKLVSFL